MIVDAHAHIFPETIAMKASKNIADFYSMPVVYDGRLDTLLREGGACGVGHFIVQSVATIPAQAASINRFVAEQVSLRPETLTGLGTLHPASEDLDADIERILRLGLKGVKLHPDFQRFAIDEPIAFAIYERIEGRLPLLLHVGDSRFDFSAPRRLAAAKRAFPKLTVVAAHLGGWSEWNDALTELSDLDIYIDTSSSLYALPPERALEIIRAFGTEHVLFGTDYPMWEYAQEMARFDRLDLSDEERKKILCENARRVFRIP